MGGVCYNLQLRDLSDFTDSYLMSLVLKYFKKDRSAPDGFLSITINILHQLCHALYNVILDSCSAALFHVIFTLVFHTFVRPWEVTQSSYVIQFKIRSYNIRLLFPSSKANLVGITIDLITITSQKHWCPVHYTSNYLKLRAFPREPLPQRKPISCVKSTVALITSKSMPICQCKHSTS